MALDTREIIFVVSGKAQLTSTRGGLPPGTTLKAAARLGARRGGADTVQLRARVGEDIVLLHLANGPTLYLNPENARELLRAQAGTMNSSTRGGGVAPTAENEVIVPAQLGWRGLDGGSEGGATRGKFTDWIGDVGVDAVEVVTGLITDKAARLAAAAVTKKMDAQVDAGVYQLSPQALVPLKGSGQKIASVLAAPRAEDPLLILVHGTFSNTAGTFAKLWARHPSNVQELFKYYGGRVYGLDHETCTASPFGNALTLVNALPDGARLHLVTHSRGGMVAESLARVCAGLGTSDADLALFAGDDYKQHRQDLTELARQVKRRNIKVDRIVRVACPARGTLLASRRLDAYLSVVKWGLEIAGLPVIPELVNFIGEVARRRADPAELPGLEAMMPNRPVTKWLNAPAEPIAGDLRVVAGDIEGDSLTSWIKTLLSDAFYWTDNDLVVQTRSMYGGTPRGAGAATFVLDRGGKVTHFDYFSNDRTADLITRALIDAAPKDFSAIGPLSWAGEDASGTRAARATSRLRAGNAADRPAVFVLPGILGSNLKVDGKRIWLSIRFINHLDRLKWNAKTADRVSNDGPVGLSYDDLIDYLADSHEVIPFGFDWRRPIEDEASRLADEVDKALAVRKATQKPVRLVAHSMGGLVARTMRLERPETWKRFMARPGARFLMLGTPNAGSFAPMQVMSGDDSFGNLFAMFGSLFDGQAARQIVAEMPGLLQLQAGLVGGKIDLGKESAWRELEAQDLASVDKRISEHSFWHNDTLQRRAMEWGIPPQAVLNRAVELRNALDKQLADFGTDAANTVLVVGNAKATPADIGVVDGNVVYLDTANGDGRVTLSNAMLPGVKTWRVDVAHGDLAKAKKSFDAYLELLNTGDTPKLPRVIAAVGVRGASSAAADSAALVPSRPSRSMRADAPPSSINEVFAPQEESRPASTAQGSRLNVRVTNGNLMFVRNPLLLGHYDSSKLTGTERVIDRLVGNVMSESLAAHVYPSAIGSHQVFSNKRRNPANPYALPRPAAAIVIGLGDEGELRMSGLIDSVRQGVIAYAQRVAEREGGAPANFELAATLIGSGGIAISTGVAAQAVTTGVRQANVQLVNVGWPVVTRLQLIELYLDRAAEALAALRSMGETEARGVDVEPFIDSGQGGLPRPPEIGYRGAEYEFISVYQRKVGTTTELDFTLSTGRAREEVRGAVAQSKLVDDLVASGACDANEDPRIGRTLFKLLVPIELEPFLAGSTALQLQLDKDTAAYPWEMLDLQRDEFDSHGDAIPWGIQTHLLRKLRTAEFRAAPRSAGADAGALVIGEPQCPPDRYPPLPGAAAEARAVAEVLQTNALLNAGAKSVVNSVFDRSYSILHISGHGDFFDGIGGVVLSDGNSFGPREIKAMRIVPDLAFINCCHLGRFANEPDRPPPTPSKGLPAFAANVAEELIRIGVRCVIAAGWAVDDDAAMKFAQTFYGELKKGQRFVEAVGRARALTQDEFPRSNTWAAYQCYGDPDWTYGAPGVSDSTASTPPVLASAAALLLQLVTLQTNYKFNAADKQWVRDELLSLHGACGEKWLRQGGVAAAFGAVYAEIGDFETAITWYQNAVAAEDGGASIRTLEQLGNARARHGARIKSATEVRAGIELLEHVVSLGRTAERLSILGSACKLLSGIAADAKSSRAALQEALGHYRAAADIARENKASNLFYPALNCLSIELRLHAGEQGVPLVVDPVQIQAIRDSLKSANDSDPDFWSVIGDIELSVYEALAKQALGGVLDDLLTEVRDVSQRVTSSKDWDSVTVQTRETVTAYLKTPGLSEAEKSAAKKLLAALPEAETPKADAPDDQKKRKKRPAARKARRPK